MRFVIVIIVTFYRVDDNNISFIQFSTQLPWGCQMERKTLLLEINIGTYLYLFVLITIYK